MNSTKLVLLLLNGAYASLSELFRPAVNRKFTRADTGQIKLTRVWALVGPGVDTPLLVYQDEITRNQDEIQ